MKYCQSLAAFLHHLRAELLALTFGDAELLPVGAATSKYISIRGWVAEPVRQESAKPLISQGLFPQHVDVQCRKALMVSAQP